MIAKLVRTAVIAGAVAGAFAWTLQMAKTAPLILKAEVYEEMAEKAAAEKKKAEATAVQTQAQAHTHAPGTAAHSHESSAPAGHSHGGGKEWEPENGFERNAYTYLASTVAGVGFAFLLVGAMALSGRKVDWKAGIIWGLAGYAAFYLSPALGLAPEMPGIEAAPLGARQAWWLLTAAATAGGLGLVFFAKGWIWKAAAALLILAPHVVGAPQHVPEPGLLPAALAAEFAVASLITVGLFWLALGGLTGYLYDRFDRA